MKAVVDPLLQGLQATDGGTAHGSGFGGLPVSVRRIAFLPGTFGRCGKVTATAVKAYGY